MPESDLGKNIRFTGKGGNRKILKIDFSQAHLTVEGICSTLNTGESFSAGQLTNFIFIHSKWYDKTDKDEIALIKKDIQNALHYWRQIGILTITKKGNTRENIQYPFDQIRRATMAAYLKWEKDVTDAEIAGAISVWSNPFLRESASVKVDNSEAERAKVILIARSLAAVVCLLIGEETPPGSTFLILRPMTDQESKLYRTTRTFQKKNITKTELSTGDVVIGSTTNQPEAEILLRIKDFEDYISRMQDLTFYCIRIDDPIQLTQPYVLMVGPTNLTDPRSRRFISHHENNDFPGPENIRNWNFLCRIIEYIFSVLLKLNTYISGSDSRYRLMSQPDILEVALTAVLPAYPALESAALWVKEGTAYLTLRAFSPSYKGVTGTPLQLDELNNLESISCIHNERFILDDLVKDDPRIPIGDNHLSSQPFALIPVRSRFTTEGVLYLGIDPKVGQNTHLFKGEEDFLDLISEIIAEVYHRQLVADISHFIRRQPEIIIKHNEDELKGALVQIFTDQVFKQLQKKDAYQMDEYLALYYMIFDPSGENSIQDWYDDFYGRRMITHIRSKIISPPHSPAENICLYHVRPGTIVILVKRTFVEDPEHFQIIRNDLREEFRVLNKGFKSSFTIHVWSIHFSYANLKKLMLDNNVLTPESIPPFFKDFFLDRHYFGTLKNISALSQAEQFMTEGKHIQAIQLLNPTISSKDPDPYLLRRLSDAYAAEERWDLAYKMAMKALEEKPPYAGSFTRLARAFVGLRRFSEALEQYRLANETSADTRFQIDYVEALILYGDNKDHWEKAVKILDTLIGNNNLSVQRKIWVRVLRSRIEMILSKDQLLANDYIKTILSEDPGNPFISWELRSHDSPNRTQF